ncbi:MAG: pyridoxal phosphate-dependent aminotransferase [Chitinophagales bacterium]|nr:pyridoxal phosphate-dependent aminotransferase [Chitinophagales bacterium]
MHFKRMSIESESPEEMGYASIQYNLAESSVRDIYFRDLQINLDEVFLCYAEHRGNIALRNEIVKNEKDLSADDVLVCPSAATALFIISTTLLNDKDHLVVLRPNYATNIETPRAINCEISFIDLQFESGFQLDIEQIKNAVKPNTKLISLTSPHNPTGVVFDNKILEEIIAFATERNINVLVDETYRYLNFQRDMMPYYAAKSDKVISVCSLSKAHGTPGIRTGWLITKNKKLQHDFLAAKEQIIICNSVVDEAIALHILQQENYLQKTHEHIRKNFSVLKNWMDIEQHYLEWIRPNAGVVCFPRIKKEYTVDTKKFYTILYEQFKTFVGAGHWFEQADHYFRLGFGYPTEEELQQGLKNIDASIEASIVSS